MAEETAQKETAQKRQRSSPRYGLVYGLGAGMIFWGAHIAGMPALQPYICHTEQTILWHLLSIATIIPILPAILISRRYWKSEESSEGVVFLGKVGVLVSVISIVAIVAEWAPVFFLDPCAA